MIRTSCSFLSLAWRMPVVIAAPIALILSCSHCAWSEELQASNPELRLLPSVAAEDEMVRSATHQEIVNPAERSSAKAPETIALPQEASAGLTLEQLEQMSLANNPAIARAGAEVRALRGKWEQVGLPPNPTVGYVASEIGDDGAAGQQGGYVGQQYVTGGKLGLNRQMVAQEIRSAEQRLAAQQQRVLTDVRLVYYAVLTAQRKVELAEELLDVNSKAAVASQQLFNAQEISRAALLQTQIQQNGTSILLQHAQNQWHADWRRLAAVVGETELSDPQPLEGNLEAVLVDLSWEEQLTRLTVESPEIAEAVAELQRSRWALDRACVEATPNVNTQLSVQYDDATKNTIAGVQVGLPLPLWNRNQGGIRQAQAEVTAAQQNIERVELSLKRRLAEAFRAYADASFQVESYSKEILPKAKETFELIQNGYENAEVGYLDLLTAQRTYSQTSLEYIEAQRNLWQSAVRIEGLLLENSLRESP